LHALATRICGFLVPSSCLSFAKIFIWTEASTSCLVSEGSQVAYSLIYVDDIILTASSTTLLRQIIASLLYVIQLLERAHMANYNPSRTLVDTESKLGPEGVPVHDPTLYRSLIPRAHLASIKRTFMYFSGTYDFGLHLYSSFTTSLVGYTDAYWAVTPLLRQSITFVNVFFKEIICVLVLHKRQQTSPRSSVEAEYRGVANVVVETAWLCNLLRELHSPLSTTTLVYYNNVSGHHICQPNPVQHQRNKHIEIDNTFRPWDIVTTVQTQSSSGSLKFNTFLRFYFKVQEKTQLSRIKCMNSLRAIQSQLKFLIETLQDFGNMPIFKRTFSQDLDLLENHLTKEIISQTDCKTTLTKLRTMFENAFSSEIKARMQNYTRYDAQSFYDAMIFNMDSLGKYMLELILHQQRTPQLLKQKKLMQTQEDHSNPIPALNVDSLKVDLVVHTKTTCLRKEESNSETTSSKSLKECSLNSKTKDVHAIKYKMSKAKERCMAYFRSLHSHLQVLSKDDLKGTRIEHGFKRAFMSLFGQDVDTFTRIMLLNVDQLQKQLDKDEFQEDGSMTSFWVVNNQFQKFIDVKFTLDHDSQMIDTYFVEYTGIKVKHFRDTLLQHLGNVKKSIAERTRHQRQTDSTVQDDNSRSRNDTNADDTDIRPIYDEEPMAEAVSDKTSPRSDLRWKPIGRIFKSVGLRWIPVLSFTLDYDSQMTYTYFVEYTGIAVTYFRDTLLQHLGNVKKSVAKRTRHQRQYERRVNKRQMQTQESKIDMEVHQAAETVTKSNELDLLFGPLFDEYFNGENQVVLKSSVVTTNDASNKHQQQPDSTSSTSTLATTVTANGNFDL
ncbi:zinc finger, CCHC-type containing protein, partial [Tanacetum coccineum]